jgi:hypothetical protein
MGRKRAKDTKDLFPNTLPANALFWVLTALAAGVMSGVGTELGKAILKETGRNVEQKTDVPVPKELK